MENAMSQLWGVIYFGSVISAVSGFCMIRKNSSKLNFITDFLQQILMFMCFQTVVGWILNIVSLPISIRVVGGMNIAFSIVCFWFAHKKGRQKFYVEYIDIMVMGIIFIVALSFGIHQFGKDLDIFNYQSPVDSSRHLQFARSVAVNHTLISSRPFMAINTGLLFEGLGCFMSPQDDYKWILLVEVYMLFMSGGIFWTLIRRKLKTKGLIIVGLVVSVFYMLGYPLNNMVFGTSYLGAGVTVSILVFSLIECYDCGNFSTAYFVFSIIITLLALLNAYDLFFPIVLIGVLVFEGMRILEKRAFFNERLNLLLLLLLCIGCLLSILFIFKIMPKDSSIIQSLSTEGYMYNSLFGDFIFLFPFVLYRLYKGTRDRRITFDYCMCLFLISYVIGLLGANYMGKMSTYYFFKSYYMVWMMAFYLMILDISECEGEERKIWCVYGSAILMLFVFLYSGIEKHLERHSTENGKNLNWELQADFVFRIYTWNYSMGSISNMYISDGLLELYNKVSELAETPNNIVQYVGPYEFDNYGFYAIARQWEKNTFYWGDAQPFINNAQKNSQYIIYVYSDRVNAPQELLDYLGTLNVVFENDTRRIVEIEKSIN